MAGATLGKLALSAATLQGLSMLLTVVPALGLHAHGFVKRQSALASNGSDAFEQRHELRDIVALALGTSTLTGTRCVSTRRWCLLPALRRSVGFGPVFSPWTARTDELSGSTREKSGLSAPRSLVSSTCCSRVDTPARCHARSRRQNVMSEPQLISLGSIPHATPDCNTNKIPVRTRRSSGCLRPEFFIRRSEFQTST